MIIKKINSMTNTNLELPLIQPTSNKNINYNNKLQNNSIDIENNTEIINLDTDNIQENLDQISCDEIKKDNYIIQGITQIEDTILITAYKNKKKSKVYLYNANNGSYKGEIILNNKAHVGGISYDEENKILYIAGNSGKTNAYSYEGLNTLLKYSDVVDLNKADLGDIVLKNDINVSQITKVGKTSTIYFYNNTG